MLIILFQINNLNTFLVSLLILSLTMMIVLIFLTRVFKKKNMSDNLEDIKHKKNFIVSNDLIAISSEIPKSDSDKDVNIENANKLTNVESVDIKSENTENPENRIRNFSDASNDLMFCLGMSIQGKSHVRDKTPCQDFHKIEILDNEKNFGIVVVSDGAGSAKMSEEGSTIVCETAIEYLKTVIESNNWMSSNNLPDERAWDIVIRGIINNIQVDLLNKSIEKNCELKSFAATFLLLFFTPKKTFFAHVGDGRSGIKIRGEWDSIMTPHKGEEADQTVFMTNEILKPPDLKISGVSVPETKVIKEDIEAFILMTDGCEDGLWRNNKKVDMPDGGFQIITINKPFVPAIEKLFEFIKKSDNKEKLLFEFLERYNKNLQDEFDDKTVVFGFLK